ncbi:hypothetical protein ABZR86_00285 [Dyella marensis]|uniref:hypothetical protein n=1 Tax=Dyella TaxID=231454 RepID=UPI00116019A0|nr:MULTISPECIES: hypothetical protein [Dyella]
MHFQSRHPGAGRDPVTTTLNRALRTSQVVLATLRHRQAVSLLDPGLRRDDDQEPPPHRFRGLLARYHRQDSVEAKKGRRFRQPFSCLVHAACISKAVIPAQAGIQ